MVRAHSRRSLRSRSQLSDEVADHVRELIMSGQVRAGEFLRLDKLAAELGVSVTPVREALAALRGEDMVDLEPSRGYVVTPFSRQDIEDVFGLQADLAGELAVRASARMPAEVLDELTELQSALNRAVRSVDVPEVERAEFEFHRLINRTADSRKLSWFLKSATRYLPQHFYSGDAGWRRTVRRDHNAILKALRADDPEAVREPMVQHVTDGGRRLVKHLEKTGIWEPEAD